MLGVFQKLISSKVRPPTTRGLEAGVGVEATCS